MWPGEGGVNHIPVSIQLKSGRSNDSEKVHKWLCKSALMKDQWLHQSARQRGIRESKGGWGRRYKDIEGVDGQSGHKHADTSFRIDNRLIFHFITSAPCRKKKLYACPITKFQLAIWKFTIFFRHSADLFLVVWDPFKVNRSTIEKQIGLW